jgi:hypothetical protein
LEPPANPGRFTMIIDVLTVALALVEKVAFPLRTVLLKTAVDLLVIFGTLYTRRFANPDVQLGEWSLPNLIYFVTLGASFLMFAFSAYMIITYVVRR